MPWSFTRSKPRPVFLLGLTLPAVLLLVRHVGPPWPSGLALPLLSALLVVLGFGLGSLGRARSSRVRLLVASLALAGIAILASQALSLSFVVTQTKRIGDPGQQREVKVSVLIGYALRPEIETGDLPARELLQRHAFDPERVWTRGSILTVRLLLLGSFLIGTFALGLAVGLAMAPGAPVDAERLRILHVCVDPLRMHPSGALDEAGQLNVDLLPFSARIAYTVQPQCSREHLSRMLNRIHPQVLQLSGHGDIGGEIALIGSSLRPDGLSKKELALLLQGRPELRVLLLDHCHSLVDVENLSGCVDVVIGVHKKVRGLYPVAFSRAFYNAIAGGRTVHQAFADASVATAPLAEPGEVFDLWLAPGKSGDFRLCSDGSSLQV